jgi:DNA repair protein RecO (recombination protein O)
VKTYKARGIVLHTVKYGDSSLVVYLLTDLLGRQTYMVQGVRSSRGHGNRGALLQPMFVLEFEGLETPRAEMHRMREVRAAVPLRSVPFDVRKSTVALFMAEMLYRLVRAVEPNSPLFDFVLGAVEALDPMEQGVADFHLRFMVGLSRHLGFFPGNEWAPGHRFDIREGLFTPIMPRHGSVFSHENSELLAVLMDMPDFGAENPPSTFPALNRTRRVDFLNAMLAYFGYHLDAGRDIRSVDILREVF